MEEMLKIAKKNKGKQISKHIPDNERTREYSFLGKNLGTLCSNLGKNWETLCPNPGKNWGIPCPNLGKNFMNSL